MILWEDFCDLLDVLERPQDQSLRQVLKRLRPHVDPSQETIRTRERLKAEVLPLPLQASSPVECIAVQGGGREADLQRLPHRCVYKSDTLSDMYIYKCANATMSL